MDGATLLLVATPIFGFALQLEDTSNPMGISQLAVAAEMEEGGAAEEGSDSARLREAIERRESLKPWHVVFGNLAWASTTATVILGFLSYSDRYGFGAAESDTPCARGDPVLGTDVCDGVPIAHAIAAGALTLFYGAAFATSLAMPDPYDLAEAEGTLASRVRVHRLLRWALLGLLVAQVVFGAVDANVDVSYETHQSLAAAHLVLGVSTWLTMGVQGVLGSLLAY